MKKENMTEQEFTAQMISWASAGHFDQPDPCLNLRCSFEWLENADQEYIRMCMGEYGVFGYKFICTPDSKVCGIMLNK